MVKMLVKCKYCNIQFDRNSEPCEKVGERRYAHKACADKYKENLSQEELDYMELEKYIKKLYKQDELSAKIIKQIRDYKKQYNFTFSGMQKTLYWWYEVKKHSLEDSYGGIGIIPYVYKDASDYFYTLFMAKAVNKDRTSFSAEVQEIEIGSPRAIPAKIKLFNLDGE